MRRVRSSDAVLSQTVCFSSVSGSLGSDTLASAMESADLSSEAESDGRPEPEIEIGFLRVDLEEANEVRPISFVLRRTTDTKP